MPQWYLNNLDILQYEENEVVSKNLVKNGKNEIGNLNRRINGFK